MGLDAGSLMTGWRLALNRQTGGGTLSFWSRGARTSVHGNDGPLSLGGDVRTTMVGTDYEKDR